MSELTDLIANLSDEKPDYMAHNINNTKISYGLPPVRIRAWEYIAAWHEAPQSKKIMCLTGDGIFVNNRNISGVIEIGIMSSTVSAAAIELMDLTGIPVPIIAVDTSAVGSVMSGLACKKIGFPEWRRGLVPGLSIYRFETTKLIISSGLRKSDS